MAKNPNHARPRLSKSDLDFLRNLAYDAICKLETTHGIDASGKEDRFAGFSGRDSMITCLKLIRIYRKKPDQIYLRIIKKTLQTAANLQGKISNPLSGEEPGKIIHTYKKRGYRRLINLERPWYTYPDKTLRNYDSVDATPLFLILAAEFYNLTGDAAFLKQILPSIKKAFNWIENFGHKSGRAFLEYLFQRPKPFGGLANQGWMDSSSALLISGKPSKEPIALVEVQGYYFKALRLWSEIFKISAEKMGEEYKERAKKLKEDFNKLFLIRSKGLYFLAQAILAHKAHIIEIRSNPGHCLWASVFYNGKYESIINDKYIPNIVARLMEPDLFAEGAGIRTLSTNSHIFGPRSYHNGSIWPFDNGLIAEGFDNFGFNEEHKRIKYAVLHAIKQFKTPLELYCAQEDGRVKEWKRGRTRASKTQAWTAATILDFTT